jgi:hypothetical protein
MLSSRTGLSGRPGGRRGSIWAGLAVLGLLATTGCQVEYAGMTLPSGKYFHDDVQYFAPGPEFPYANTQAATQRAKMQAAGIPLPPVPSGGSVTLGGPNIGPDGRPYVPALAPGAIPNMGTSPSPEIENAIPGQGQSAPPATPTPPIPGAVAPGSAVPPPPG